MKLFQVLQTTRYVALVLIIGATFVFVPSASALFPSGFNDDGSPTFGTSGLITPPTSPTDTAQPLRVTTRVVEPFVIDQKEDRHRYIFKGYSIELLHSIKAELNEDGNPYGLNPAQQGQIRRGFDIKTPEESATKESTVKSLIESVIPDESGKTIADLSIASISVTSEREAKIDYSVPIFNSALLTMRTAKNAPGPNVARTMGAILAKHEVWSALLYVALFIVVVAHLIYFFDNRHPKSPWYNEPYPHGVFETLWWSLTTLVGQEESHPRSGLGRLMGTSLLVSGILFVSLFTASFASELTLQGLSGRGPESLEGQTVLTVKNSTSEMYLQNRKTELHIQNIIAVEKITEAYTRLKNNEADAIVYDAPVLQYYSQNQGRGKVVTVGSVFHPEYYAIAFPAGSPWREPINRAILSLTEDGKLADLTKKWLGKENIYSVNTN